jgi:hypothetical protein
MCIPADNMPFYWQYEFCRRLLSFRYYIHHSQTVFYLKYDVLFSDDVSLGEHL